LRKKEKKESIVCEREYERKIYKEFCRYNVKWPRGRAKGIWRVQGYNTTKMAGEF